MQNLLPYLKMGDNEASEERRYWYVMRDLKRANAKERAWKMLEENGYEVFTPMHWKISASGGKRIRKLLPVISDLLFVHSSRPALEAIVKKTPTLQFRFVKNTGAQPMTVRDEDMQRFIIAVGGCDSVRYYAPDELEAAHGGKCVRIIGGPLNGYEGKLLSVRGSKVKRLLIELPHLLCAAIEVKPEYIEIIK